MYTVGQLSKLTGVSVRTLHYYEKQGLLQPDRNTGNQYRSYSEDDILRLQKIAVLKQMHFKLSEIKVILDKGRRLTTMLPSGAGPLRSRWLSSSSSRRNCKR